MNQIIKALSVLFFLVVVSCGGSSSSSQSNGTNHTNSDKLPDSFLCRETTTLEQLITCVVDNMPGKNSEGFTPPTEQSLNDIGTVISGIMEDQCQHSALPTELRDHYVVWPFTDTDNLIDYCVLLETADQDNNGSVDLGWGTFIWNRGLPEALSIQIPHPLYDTNTWRQGISLYKELEARAFFMAGTHRNSNATASNCQPYYHESDVAHNTQNLFHRASEQLLHHDGGSVDDLVIQFHGMGTSSCDGVNAYLTHGSSSAHEPSDAASLIRDSLISNNSWSGIAVPGDSLSCNLNGSTNVQGRLFNGVTNNVCTTSAPDYSGSFVHIEQKRDYREPEPWFIPLQETLPNIVLP